MKSEAEILDQIAREWREATLKYRKFWTKLKELIGEFEEDEMK